MRKRVDNNHTRIVKELRDTGYSVLDLHEVGNDCPDICVGIQGINFLFEIKSKHGRLSKGQKKLQEEWFGQIDTIYDTSDALQIMRRRIC